MVAVPGGVWRAVTGGNTAVLPVLVWAHLGLLLKFSDAQCSPEMCERPPSTITSEPSSTVSCYDEAQTLDILCKPGFRQLGDRYTAVCDGGGVWVSDGVCRVDLFSILVAVSASMVAILVFALAIFVLSACLCFPGKKRRKAKVTNAKRKRGVASPRAAAVGQDVEIGRVAGKAADHYENHEEDMEDDFTDDEEDILPNRKPKPSNEQDNIYQNQQF